MVLGEAETEGNGPNPIAINYFLQNVSDATAPFTEDVLPNSQNDFDQEQQGAARWSSRWMSRCSRLERLVPRASRW